MLSLNVNILLERTNFKDRDIGYNNKNKENAMHWELGIGQHKLIIYNAERNKEINAMLERIATAYSAMLCMGYPMICDTYKQCTLVFTDKSVSDFVPTIAISLLPCGIYVMDHPYQSRVARKLHNMTGLPIQTVDTSRFIAEIGIGGVDTVSEKYVLLKDALLSIPLQIY